MPLHDATLQSLGNHLASIATHVALHTADPGTTGANPSSAARLPANWVVDADGDLSLDAAKNFTGGAANGPVTHVVLWSALTGGTARGAYAITGDSTFNSAGEYRLDSLVINGTAP